MEQLDVRVGDLVFDAYADGVSQYFRALREGAQIIESADIKPPVPMLGHVTSSYYSPELGRSIAMAVVRDGISRRSENGIKAGRDVLYAWAGGKAHKVKVVSPVFVDPEGARQNV